MTANSPHVQYKTILLFGLISIVFGMASNSLADDLDGDGSITVLLPLVVTDHPGRFDSTWSTDVWFYNQSQDSVSFLPLSVCSPAFPDCRPHHEPGFLGRPKISQNSPFGYLLYLTGRNPANAVAEKKLHFNLRVFEHSRRSQAVGVEIPVVREDEFFESETALLAVPTGDGIRSRLRVFDRNPSRDHSVLVEFLDMEENVMASRILYLDQGSSGAYGVNYPLVPGFNWIGDITGDFPQLLALERFNIRITPRSETMSYWAFVSVTDNTSQHVLLVTPQ